MKKKNDKGFFSLTKGKAIIAVMIAVIFGFSLFGAMTCLISSGSSCLVFEIIALPLFIFAYPFLGGSGYLALFVGFITAIVYSYLISCVLVWVYKKIRDK